MLRNLEIGENERERERGPREEEEQAWCWGEGLSLEKVNNVIVDLMSKFWMC